MDNAEAQLTEAVNLLKHLVEIIEESESDPHWTNRVEWLADDAENFLDRL